jgi:hypothetical protein
MNNPTGTSDSSAAYASWPGDEEAGRAVRLIRRATTGAVLFLAGVAGVVSYSHIHLLAMRYRGGALDGRAAAVVGGRHDRCRIPDAAVGLAARQAGWRLAVGSADCR